MIRKSHMLFFVPLLVALIGGVATVEAQAQAARPPSASSVDRLLAATEARRLGDHVILQVQDMIRPMFERALAGSALKLTPEQQLLAGFYAERFATRAQAMLQEEVGWQRMREVNRAIYTQAFSQTEIDALTAFYESPAGHVSVEKMPIAVQQAMDEMQSRLVPLMLKLRMAAEQQVEEMAAAR